MIEMIKSSGDLELHFNCHSSDTQHSVIPSICILHCIHANSTTLLLPHMQTTVTITIYLHLYSLSIC